MSVNKVILVGRLGQDPESRAFPNSGSVCNLSIATTEIWRDKQTGERQERTEWHRVTLRNKLGEIAQQYLRKGSQVYIEGRIQTRKWQDQNGQDRYSTEIVGNEMTMLGGRDGGNSSGGTYQSTAAGGASAQRSEYSSTGASSEPPSGGYYDDDMDFPF